MNRRTSSPVDVAPRRTICCLAGLLLSVVILEAVGVVASPLVSMPQGPGRGPIAGPRDPELEKQSERNLEVAKFYFFKRKPEKNDQAAWDRLNKAVESRLMEIVDTHPSFAKMDEVYFLLGEVYQRAGDLPAAREQWTRVTQDFPESEFRDRARKRIESTTPPSPRAKEPNE
jgi:Asp-tRNA(Asn)/Glu-tRNA(Gln) amidotransferase A subunit family amidase